MLSVSINPSVELINAIQYHLGEAERVPESLEIESSDYRIALLDRFSFTDHPVFHHYRSMIPFGFSYDAPHVLLHCFSWPGLSQSSEIPESIIDRSGGMERITRFIDSFRDYGSISDPIEFFQHWQDWYDQLLQPIKSHLSEIDIPKAITAYFGKHSKHFSVEISPLISGGYSLNTKGEQVVALLGLSGFDSSMEDFWWLDEYLLHEFTHAFVNPTADQFKNEIEALSPLLAPIVEKMKPGYNYWSICLNEHIVRTVTTQLHSLMGNHNLAQGLFQGHFEMGFIYLETVLKVLDDQRVKGEPFSDFSKIYRAVLIALGKKHSPISEK